MTYRALSLLYSSLAAKVTLVWQRRQGRMGSRAVAEYQ
jgi:hypothetical protein